MNEIETVITRLLLAQIASTQRQGDMSDEQAEYASLQTYALGLMQFQMLSTLHDILGSKIEKDEEPEKNAEPSSQLDRAHATKVPGGTLLRRKRCVEM